MKRKHVFLFVIKLLIVTSFTGCYTDIVPAEKIFFRINPEDRKISIPVSFNDSLSVDLIFDTGISLGSLLLDSTFCAEQFLHTLNVLPDATIKAPSIAWANDSSLLAVYHTPVQINIGENKKTYNSFLVKNWKKILCNDKTNGLFTIPANDTAYIWELNFEQNYLEIHQTTNFIFPKDCHFLPLVVGPRDSSLYVQMPLKIKSADGDTLTMNHAFLIDTAMPWDIMCVYPAKELSFFEGKDAIWTASDGSYNRRYTVTAKLSKDFVIDSLRVYTLDDPYLLGTQYLIGLNFLKRFNVFFDMHNRQLGLQPIKNFKRAVNPNYRRFHLSFREDSSGKRIVNKVADYKGNRYKEAGIQEGDQILSVNDSSQVKVFNIIRNGKPLRITVIDDPNEEQGD